MMLVPIHPARMSKFILISASFCFLKISATTLKAEEPTPAATTAQPPPLVCPTLSRAYGKAAAKLIREELRKIQKRFDSGQSKDSLSTLWKTLDSVYRNGKDYTSKHFYDLCPRGYAFDSSKAEDLPEQACFRKHNNKISYQRPVLSFHLREKAFDDEITAGTLYHSRQKFDQIDLSEKPIPDQSIGIDFSFNLTLNKSGDSTTEWLGPLDLPENSSPIGVRINRKKFLYMDSALEDKLIRYYRKKCREPKPKEQPRNTAQEAQCLAAAEQTYAQIQQGYASIQDTFSGKDFRDLSDDLKRLLHGYDRKQAIGYVCPRNYEWNQSLLSSESQNAPCIPKGSEDKSKSKEALYKTIYSLEPPKDRSIILASLAPKFGTADQEILRFRFSLNHLGEKVSEPQKTEVFIKNTRFELSDPALKEHLKAYYLRECPPSTPAPGTGQGTTVPAAARR